MRRRRILLIFVGFPALLVAATYFVLTFTGASQSLVESVLSGFIKSRFELRGAEVNPASGRVRLEGVHIAHPKNVARTVLTADSIELDVNTNPLGAGSIGDVRRVVADKLNLHLSLLDGERFDLPEILKLPEGSTEPGALPVVSIKDSRVTISLTAGRPEIEFDAVQLEIAPETPGGSRVLLQGSMLTPAGFPVQIQGSGDFANGSVQVLLESHEVPLQPSVAKPFSAEVEQYLQQAALRGLAHHVALWLQHPAEPGDDGPLTVRLSAELAGVACTPPQFPYPFSDAAGRISASTRNGGHVHFDLTAQRGESRFAGRGDLTQCLSGSPQVAAELHATAVPADEQLHAALQPIRAARDVYAAFQPAGGLADVELELSREPAQNPKIGMSLTLRGVSGSFYGFPTRDGGRQVAFPYRLERLDGTVELRGDEVRFGPIQGTRADGTKLQIEGRVAGLSSAAPEQSLEVAITGQNVRFSPELRTAVDALLEQGGAIYDTYTPSGEADLNVRVSRPAGSPRTRVQVGLQLRDCTATYREFPYTLDHLGGQVDIGDDGVNFDLNGTHDGAEVALIGRFAPHAPESGLAMELWVHGRGLAIDESLHTALGTLDPSLLPWWERLQPQGRFDCRLSVRRPVATNEFSHDLRIDVQDGSLAIERLAQRLEHLTGSVFVHGTGPRGRVDISVLRGQIDHGDATPAQAVIEGSIELDGQRETLDLTTLVRGVKLGPELANALDRAGAISRETWDWLRPSGTVDIVSRQRKLPGDEATAHQLHVQLRDLRSDAAVLPSPLTSVSGELVVTEGSGTFHGLRGRMGTAEISCPTGSFTHDEGMTTVEVAVVADELAVDESLAKLATGPLQQAFLARQILGALRINVLHLTYRIPDQSDDFELDFSGQVVARNLRMMLGIPIEELNGVVEFTRGRIMSGGGLVQASVRDLSFGVLGQSVSELNANLEIDPERLRLDQLTARLHGGQIASLSPDEPALVCSLDGSDTFAGNVRWNGVSLTELLRASGQTAPAARGSLEGELRLAHLRSHDLPSMRATGQINISSGRLGEVPLFTAIYSYLAPKDRPRFDGAGLRFAVSDGRIQIDDLLMKSPLLEVKGSGSIGLDGYVDIGLEFPDFFASAGNWLILPQILQSITSQVVRFQVYGWIHAPRARPLWLFQGDPERLRIEPLPPRRRQPLRHRF